MNEILEELGFKRAFIKNTEFKGICENTFIYRERITKKIKLISMRRVSNFIYY